MNEKEESPQHDPLEAKIGKKFRDAEELDQKTIAIYFSSQGFKVLEINQQWRNVHGKLRKGNETFFLKLGSTPAIGENVQNEVSFNRSLHALIKESGATSFDVPEIRDTGIYDGRFYYLSTVHDGELLATKMPPDMKELSEWLDSIIQSNLFLLSARDLALYRDQHRKDFVEGWDVNFPEIASWYEKVRTNQLERASILEEVARLPSVYVPGTTHGDFVPWHMIKEGKKFILIDGEHASQKMPKYYDSVYFYHRLYTSGHASELAKKYLTKVRNSLNADEQDKFDAALKPVLAIRIIGGLWDAKMDTEQDLTHHEKLIEDFANDRLLSR